jgi:hypothetical protein
MRLYFFSAATFVVTRLTSLLERINYAIIDHIFAINRGLETNDADKLSAKTEDVLNDAKKHSENPVFEQKEREFVYYHYLIKHYTAVFESYFEVIPPIQIFNESRMAISHFIVAKEKKEDDKDDSAENMSKAVNHMLRGLLDLLKLNCYELRKKILKEHEKYPPKAIGLVSNGDYIKVFAELKNTAEDCMFKAKLGESDRIKTEVANKFIYALDAHDKWLQHQRENCGKIIAALTKYHIIRAGSILFAIITGVVACYIWSILSKHLEYLWNLWLLGITCIY